jgi:hypothetical protein
MNTLIIHPSDKTTDFLRPIYQDIKQKTVLKAGPRQLVDRQIERHDRIIMLGHGSPSGLFSVGRFDGAYVIDRNSVPLLKEKECIFIWCNADRFVEAHDLKGLYSGMFVSEVAEAAMCGFLTNQRTVNESNNFFAFWLGRAIDNSLQNIYEEVVPKYQMLAEDNEVASYNQKRIYIK